MCMNKHSSHVPCAGEWACVAFDVNHLCLVNNPKLAS
jgi:hypothetical protein